MTSRERVLAALNHKEPDRIPIDIGGTDVTGLHGIAYSSLKRHLGIRNGQTRIHHVYMQAACIEETVRARFHGDIVRLGFEPKAWRPGVLSDGIPCELPAGWNPMKLEDGGEALPGADGNPLIVRHASSAWFSPVGPACPFIRKTEDVHQYRHAIRLLDRSPWMDETLEDLAARASALRETTPYAIAGSFGGHIFAAAQIVRGMSNFMCDLAMDETFAVTLMDALADGHIEEFDSYIEALGPYLDVVCIADDLGAQQGPQIDPEMWRRLVKPSMKRLYTHMKGKMGPIKLFLHSCGSVRAFIPDLIEMGVDILNPVQVSAANMDTRGLKAEFGRDLVFWGGGCDTQMVLPQRTPDEVREEVARRIGDLGPGGGFVFAAVHNIQPGVPPENMEAMWDAAYTLGGRAA